MFLFLKFILAHLIADFVLQFEELYQLKIRSLWGHVLHVLIHLGVSLAMVFPYWDSPSLWIFLAGLMLVHFIQDIIKYTLTQKIPKNTFVYFMADQFVHGLAIAVILLFPISSEVRGFPTHPVLNMLYVENRWTLLAIFFILLTFGGSYTLFAYYRTYRKDARKDHGITSAEMTYMLLERSVAGMATLLVTNPLWIALTPLIGIARLPFKKLRDKQDFFISIGYSILLGLLFRLFI